jgi:hypothetical protein
MDEVREQMIGFLARWHPYALPRLRTEIDRGGPVAAQGPAASRVPSSPRAEDGDDAGVAADSL